LSKRARPLEGLSPEERLDRYATLFRWKTEEEIDVLKLVDQWDADKMGVMSMLNQARRNPNLYDDLRRKGYGDDEFPDWWYSPGRPTATVQDLARAAIETKSTVPEGQTTLPDGVRLTATVSEPLTPPPPKSAVTPAPKGAGQGRPDLRGRIASDGELSETVEDLREASSDGLTASEVDLLGSNKIVRGQDGVWRHVETEPSGRVRYFTWTLNACVYIRMHISRIVKRARVRALHLRMEQVIPCWILA
jgi:hypothetical protein